jgi:hypothetical protein
MVPEQLVEWAVSRVADVAQFELLVAETFDAIYKASDSVIILGK